MALTAEHKTQGACLDPHLVGGDIECLWVGYGDREGTVVSFVMATKY